MVHATYNVLHYIKTSATNNIRMWKDFWNKVIPTKVSLFVWREIKNRIPKERIWLRNE